LNQQALNQLIAKEGPRRQAHVAARMGIGESTLSQLAKDPKRAKRVQYRTVARMARNYGIPVEELWVGAPHESSLEGANVPRGTSDAPPEGARRESRDYYRGLLKAAHRINALASELISEASVALDQ
jgi:transcriptional regulator with XRE-family HTH domain